MGWHDHVLPATTVCGASLLEPSWQKAPFDTAGSRVRPRELRVSSGLLELTGPAYTGVTNLIAAQWLPGEAHALVDRPEYLVGHAVAQTATLDPGDARFEIRGVDAFVAIGAAPDASPDVVAVDSRLKGVWWISSATIGRLFADSQR